MAKSYGQKAKLLYLLKIFKELTDEENSLSLKEITEILNNEYDIKAERKSLYDDIETLKMLDFDICTTRDKTTRYFLASRDFELPELELLIDAVQASRFISYDKSITLIKKLQTLASKHQAKKLYRGVYISDSTKSKNQTTYYAIDAIHESIAKGHKLTFHYFTYNEKKEKVYHHNKKLYCVSPIALIWDNERYYLVAYNSENNQVRHYRVDKIDSAVCTDMPVDHQDEVKISDLDLYASSHFSMYGGKKEKVTLECENALAEVILDRFGDNVIFHRKGDVFTVTVDVMISPIFISWFFSFGNRMKIIHPQYVIDEVKKAASNVLSNYD